MLIKKKTWIQFPFLATVKQQIETTVPFCVVALWIPKEHRRTDAKEENHSERRLLAKQVLTCSQR